MSTQGRETCPICDARLSRWSDAPGALVKCESCGVSMSPPEFDRLQADCDASQIEPDESD